MGSTSSVNSGLANLIQTLSANGPSALSSALATPSVQAALEKAPTGDLVKLSDQALQLQETGLLFGNSTSTDALGTPSTSTPDALLSAALSSSLGVPAAQTSTATSASDPNSLQSQELAAILGTSSTTATTDPLLSIYG